MSPHEFENIAVVRLSSLGDVIFAMPAVTLLRQSYPQAKITWIIEDRTADVLTNNQLVDDVIVMPRKEWRAMKKNGATTSAVWRSMRAFGKILKDRAFDLVIDFQGNIKSGLVTWATRAPLRLGFARSETKEPNWLFTNRRQDIDPDITHRINRDIALLAGIGVQPRFCWPPIEYREEEKVAIDDFLKTLKGRGPLIILNPATSERLKTKRWDNDYWASLADYFVLSRQARVVVTWGPGEKELADEIVSLAKEAIHLSPPIPSIRSLGYLLRQADLVVGPDTGPLHLADIQNQKTVILFGPSDPRLYHPIDHPERALFMRLACSPCRYRECVEVDCLRLIAPSHVARICDATLDDEEIECGDLTPLKGAPT